MAKIPKGIGYESADDLRQALRYTAARTGFSVRLIEKDYYCSLALKALSPLFSKGLVFKGGTALSKVHADFYRLSEDLDFSISMRSDASRPERRAAIEPVKQHLQHLHHNAPWLIEVRDLRGANQSTQYVSELRYQSCLTEELESIRLEIGLRELLLDQVLTAAANTLLHSPLTGKPAIAAVEVCTMSLAEAYAEKVRAALCRRDAAIRDFYDLDHAFESGILKPDGGALIHLVRRKVSVPGNHIPDLSPDRTDVLRRQIEPQLRPVLREEDFQRFDLDRVLEVLRTWMI